MCLIKNITYKATCRECEERQLDEGVNKANVVNQMYIGESSRTLTTQSSHHKVYYRKYATEERRVIKDEEDPLSSFMWDHRIECHRGDNNIDVDLDYKFDLIGSHRDPLTRQISEAVRIGQANNEGTYTENMGREITINSLNRKSEGFSHRDRCLPMAN